MSATLDKIIKEVRGLPPDEQRQLVEQLNAIVPALPSEDELEDAFERELAAQGIIGEPQPLDANAAEFYAYKPITVGGKPLSEMIIEERR